EDFHTFCPTISTTSDSSALATAHTSDAPGPRGGLFFGSLLEAQRDPLEFFQRMIREHGDYVGVRFGPYRYLVVNDAEGVRQVLVDNHKSYKKSRNYQGLKLVLG